MDSSHFDSCKKRPETLATAEAQEIKSGFSQDVLDDAVRPSMRLTVLRICNICSSMFTVSSFVQLGLTRCSAAGERTAYIAICETGSLQSL